MCPHQAPEWVFADLGTAAAQGVGLADIGHQLADADDRRAVAEQYVQNGTAAVRTARYIDQHATHPDNTARGGTSMLYQPSQRCSVAHTRATAALVERGSMDRDLLLGAH